MSMNTAQLNQAVKLAQTSNELGFDGLEVFDGFGLNEFKHVTVTLSQMARLIRWQAFQFNGQIDAKALQEIAFHKRKFLIAGN